MKQERIDRINDGIGDGLVILSSQYWGRKDTETIRKVSSIAMRTALVLMLALFVIVSLFPAKNISVQHVQRFFEGLLRK